MTAMMSTIILMEMTIIVLLVRASTHWGRGNNCFQSELGGEFSSTTKIIIVSAAVVVVVVSVIVVSAAVFVITTMLLCSLKAPDP